VTDRGWQRAFEDPIQLPDGRTLATLHDDAATYITALPKKESDLSDWQVAIEALMLISRGGPTMLARIGVMKALNRHAERVFNPDRKDTRWEKRKGCRVDLRIVLFEDCSAFTRVAACTLALSPIRARHTPQSGRFP
jgi:hypothetical protein